MDDVEVLDLEKDIEIVEKNVSISNTKSKVNKEKNDNINNINIKKEKKKEKRRKLKISEKIFLTINILLILAIIGFYGYRTVYYYKLTHDIVSNPLLVDELTSLSNIAYQNDGLYEKIGYFYYKGQNVNNYVYYSGRMYRIIDVQNGIRMIDNESLTNLVWGLEEGYNESLIHSWLEKYLNNLKDYELYLKENDWCNEDVDVSNYTCNKTVHEYVGLLSTADYLQAGGKNSFLNNGTYFWTINQDTNNTPLYINSDGGINNLVNSEENYFSYGIRPVITLKEDISILSGDGTEANPYILESLGNALLRDNSVGNYVQFHNQTFKIMKIEDDGVTLILDGVVEVEKSYNDAIKYLNSEYIKDWSLNDLVKINYGINEYNYANKYNYSNVNSNTSNYVTLPNVGDLFLNEYGNYWLNTIADSKLGLYHTIDENKMFFGDLKANKHFLRPIIKLNSEMVVNDGLGTMDSPLIVGDNNVEED